MELEALTLMCPLRRPLRQEQPERFQRWSRCEKACIILLINLASDIACPAVWIDTIPFVRHYEPAVEDFALRVTLCFLKRYPFPDGGVEIVELVNNGGSGPTGRYPNLPQHGSQCYLIER